MWPLQWYDSVPGSQDMKQTREKCPTRIEFWTIHARAVEDLRWKNWSTDRIEFLENVAFLRRNISGCRFFQEMYLSAAA